MSESFEKLVRDVRSCNLCADHLKHGVRPVIQIHPDTKILIAGQAPGRRVHESGIPFNDPSGDRLREWLGLSSDEFYDDKKVGLLPMGFCYPGTGKSGDLPPRPECEPAWRSQLLSHLNSVEITLVVGQYAQASHLNVSSKTTLTETVRNWELYWPKKIVPLPHPSPRNNLWLRRNPWFELELVPVLKQRIRDLLN